MDVIGSYPRCYFHYEKPRLGGAESRLIARVETVEERGRWCPQNKIALEFSTDLRVWQILLLTTMSGVLLVVGVLLVRDGVANLLT